MIEDGFKRFAELWTPILDEFDACGVKFALEVHPTEIAFDIYTARAPLKAFGTAGRRSASTSIPATSSGRASTRRLHPGVPGPDLPRPHEGRGRDARRQGRHPRLATCPSATRGAAGISAPWATATSSSRTIIRELNAIGYAGPLSVEWEDNGMDREFGAQESLEFVRRMNFSPSTVAFDRDMKK